MLFAKARSCLSSEKGRSKACRQLALKEFDTGQVSSNNHHHFIYRCTTNKYLTFIAWDPQSFKKQSVCFPAT